MGTISLLLPENLPDGLAPELNRACMAGGPDNMPGPTEVQLEPGRLVVSRGADESGYLEAPWDIPGTGRLMGMTATLMERERPYPLLLELARGKVNQVRCQLADWRSGGLQVLPELDRKVHDLSVSFGRCATRQGAPDLLDQAQHVLADAYTAGEELVSAYVEQVFQIRHQRQPRLDTLLGCRVGSIPDGEAATALGWACNAVAVPLAWREVEAQDGQFRWETPDALLDWVESQGYAASAGPLIDFSVGRLPGWLARRAGDLGTIARFMGRYVEAAIRRYRTRIRRWQITAAGNWGNVLGLSEEEMLWLTVRLSEVAKLIDPGLEVSLTIAQPWGEYQVVQERQHSPFLFADTLIRSGVNLAALEVELVMGVTPRGSYCRDLLETSRLLDLYALLGTPLQVTLGYPSSREPDPHADEPYVVDGGHWRAGFTTEAQADWATAFVALALSKPYVQAVTWTHFSDADAHLFPHAGLVDASGELRPVLERLHQLREKHLR